jgi:hypothetical protein
MKRGNQIATAYGRKRNLRDQSDKAYKQEGLKQQQRGEQKAKKQCPLDN